MENRLFPNYFEFSNQKSFKKYREVRHLFIHFFLILLVFATETHMQTSGFVFLVYLVRRNRRNNVYTALASDVVPPNPQSVDSCPGTVTSPTSEPVSDLSLDPLDNDSDRLSPFFLESP